MYIFKHFEYYSLVISLGEMTMENNKAKAKIKYLLSTNGYNVKQYAEYLNRSQQSVNRKLTLNQYSLKDLADLADFTKTDLAFLDRDTGKPVIIISRDDIPE